MRFCAFISRSKFHLRKITPTCINIEMIDQILLEFNPILFLQVILDIGHDHVFLHVDRIIKVHFGIVMIFIQY